MTEPFASIIIPTYNHERYIGDALDSVLAQTDGDFEALVIDDGSTDRSGEIIDAYAARDPRVVAVHQANAGVAGALNEGLKRARGRWIHWLSSDDMFEPTKLETNRRWIERHPDCNFFFSYFSLLRQSTGDLTKHDLWGPLPEPEHQILGLFHRNYISGITICVRREAWDKVGHFDPDLSHAQDYDQWLRILRENKAVFIPEWLVVNRNHAEQGSEVFPEACYFDTARAAIRFVNETPFQRLVPFVDLADAAAATRAVEKCLEIACDPTSFLYGLGPNPGLILRLLEWIRSDGVLDERTQALLRELVGRHIADKALAPGNDDWSWMWRGIAVAWAHPTACFAYTPIDAVQLGLCQYASRANRGGESSAEPLKQYLERHLGVVVPPTKEIAGTSESIVLLQNGDAGELPKLAQDLALKGTRAVVIAAAPAAYTWNGGAPVLAQSAEAHDSLPWLGPVECAAAHAGTEIPVWLDARRCVAIPNADDPATFLQAEGLKNDSSPAPLRVVFLERVLWGGGAEQFVLNLAQALDRQRYAPIILTLFPIETNHPLPAGVPAFWIGDPVLAASQTWQNGATGSDLSHNSALERGICRSLLQRLLTGSRSYYYRLDPGLRQRIGIGDGIHRLRVRVVSRCLNYGRRAFRAVYTYLQRMTHARMLQLARKEGQEDLWALFVACSNHWLASHHLVRAMGCFEEDVVVITVMEEATVTAWLSQVDRKFPYIASLHTLESTYMPHLYGEQKRLAAENWLLSGACAAALRVVVPSQGCAEDLIENYAVSRERAKTIGIPVRCAAMRRASWQLLEDMPKRKAKRRFVHIGRLAPEKNHLLLLDACKQLDKWGDDYELICVGEGPERQRLETILRERGQANRVRLLGHLSNPLPLVATADALVLTSHFESFALVLVEAMICGTPVVSVDCPTGPREVLRGGDIGLLVGCGDPEALAQAMLRAADDKTLRARLIKAGFRRAEDYDSSHLVKVWEKLIDEVIGQSADNTGHSQGSQN